MGKLREAHNAESDAGKPMVAWGLDPALQGGHLHRDELDGIAGDRPLWVISYAPHFVYVNSAALAATLAGCAPIAKGAAPVAKPIGLQLYTVRELFSRDPIGTLEQVAAIGYREVEYGGGGFEAMDHAALRAAMDRVGLARVRSRSGGDHR